MSRPTNALNGSAILLGVLFATTPAWSDSIDDLKARAKKTSEPAEALSAARALRRAGLVPEAMNTVQRAFGKARGNEEVADLRLELARQYIEIHEGKKALRECDQIHKLSPFKEQLCIAEAQLLSRRGSVALPAAEQALVQVPGDYDSLVAKGRALMQLGKPPEAEATLREAQKADPKRPEALRYLGELYATQGRQGEAIQAARDAQKVAPEDPDALAMLGNTLAPGAEARDVLLRALSSRPGFPAASARLGEVLLAMGDYEGAQQRLEAALRAVPKQADWHAILGEVYLAKKAPDAAIKEAHEALKIVGNHGAAKLVEAKALAQKGDIDLAIEGFEAAYGFARTDPTVLIEAARACIKGGRLTTAKAFSNRATEDFPKSAAAWEVEGDVAAASKDVPFAKQAYGKALSGEGPVDKAGVSKKLASLK